MTTPRPTDDSVSTSTESLLDVHETMHRPNRLVRAIARTATGRVLLDRLARTRAATVLGLHVGRATPRPADPFRTLEVQRALTRLEAELHRLRHPADRTYASSHHLAAGVATYELALDDACRLAGIARPAGRGQSRRLRTELELRSLGWQW